MANLAFKAAGRLAPPGTHRTVLETIELADGAYGKPVLRFVFVVQGGDHDGNELVKICGAVLRPDSALGELAAELLGREVRRHEDVDFGQFIGRLYRVTALPFPDGAGADIEKVEPVAE